MPGSGFMFSGRLPLILQSERCECALACLAMLLGYFGYRTDLTTLRNRCPVSQHGMTLKGVLNLAGHLDLAARPLRLDMADVPRLSLPAILHWDMDHFVVLKKVRGKSLVIHDPATGCRELSWQDASNHFTGVALECQPAPGFESRYERQRLGICEIWRYSSGLAGSITQLLVLSLLLQVFALSLPFYTQLILDDVLVNGDTGLLVLLASGFLLLILFRQIAELVRSWVVMYLSNRFSVDFATRLCRHLLSLPHDYFARRHLGDIVSRFGSLNHVRDFLCSGIVEIFIDGLMVVGTVSLMLVYSPLLSLVAVLAVLLYGLIRLASYHSFKARNTEWINDRALENTCFMENISSIQGIKLFGREHARLAAWQNRYASAIHSGMRVQKLGICVQFAQGLLLGVENILLLLLGALAVIGGELTVGMLMAFIGFKDHFFRSVFSLLDKGFEFRLLDVHLERLADIAFCQPECPPVPQKLPDLEQGIPVKIALEQIAHGYEPECPPLFSQVNLVLEPGEMVVIIGPTGCGKSTLLKIAAGLVIPDTGRVTFNDRAVTRSNLGVYRASTGGVMQHDTLLSGTLLENISFFDTEPDLEKARAAARLAVIDEEIARMPMQYLTRVGDQGAALSGGQVQRLLLARALYRQPGLLILDEATSHLDIQTEFRLNQSLRKLGISTLLVAHRPETVLQADRIVLLGQQGLCPVSQQQFRELMSKKDNNDVITI